MLLFGDAFGPAYTIFWCVCIQLCSFCGGSNLKKCVQQAITLLYGRFRRSQQCCVQRMYVCMYAFEGTAPLDRSGTATSGGLAGDGHVP